MTAYIFQGRNRGVCRQQRRLRPYKQHWWVCRLKPLRRPCCRKLRCVVVAEPLSYLRDGHALLRYQHRSRRLRAETVAPVALHGADADERAAGTVVAPERLHGLHLGGVIRRNAAAVRLDEVDRRERRARALGRGREQRGERRGATRHALHERVDAIVRSEGVALALQDEKRPTFAGHRAMRVA